MEEQDYFVEEPQVGEGLPGWEVETITADTEVPKESDLPDFQNQVIDPTLMEYRKILAAKTAMELKEMIEKNNPGLARKDLQRIVRRLKDEELSKALERVGVKMGELPNGLLMGNPGNYKMNEKVEEEDNKKAFASPGLFTRASRLPYHARGWNVAQVNKYQ